MTRSQRRNRTAARQARAASFALARPAIAAGIHLDDNPNRVKRGAARLATMEGFIAELAKAQADAYSPLTVSTPVLTKRGTPGKRTTSYTI
jgi:hypothetical protein